MSTTPSGRPSTRLRKDLGLFDVYAISTGAMFSSGFFLLPGLAAAQTGPSVALAYLVAGIFILPAMLSVAELSTAMPRAGGAYYFLDRALGPVVGTVGGLGTWLALVLKSAFALVGMGAYLALFVDAPIEPLAIVLTVLFAVINIVGAKESSGLQRVLVTILVGILIVFIVQGVAQVFTQPGPSLGERFTPFFAFGLTGFAGTVGFVFVSYAGLTKVSSVAEEIRDPDRNIPLGMMLSLATATFVYTIGVAIVVAVLPADQIRDDLTPIATAAAAFTDWLPEDLWVGAIVVAAAAAFASTGNAGILSASRFPLAMSRDRLVPRQFGTVGRFGTPTFSIVATAGLMVACILLFDVSSIAKLASAFVLLLYSFLNLAVVIMRESGIDGYDPGYRSPLYPWMQIFGFVAPFWLIAEMGQLAIVFTTGLVAVTIGWYFWYARDRVERTGAIFHTFARLGAYRHAGLDMELRGIVQEKGLREDDPFDRVAARAEVLEIEGRVSFAAVASAAADRLAERTGIPVAQLRTGFVEEADAGFVPISHGAALPHLRVEGLDHPFLLLARCRDGVLPGSGRSDVLAADGEPVRAVFFLLSPQSDPGQHLRLLGHLATHVDDPGFMDRWLEADSPTRLRETLLSEDGWRMLRVGEGPGEVPWDGLHVRELSLPRGSLLALIRRGGHGIVPDGSTLLQDGDALTVIGDAAALEGLRERIVPSSGDDPPGA